VNRNIKEIIRYQYIKMHKQKIKHEILTLFSVILKPRQVHVMHVKAHY